MHGALDSGLLSGRKILFIGDSLYRQMFQSLTCLAGSNRLQFFSSTHGSHLATSLLRSAEHSGHASNVSIFTNVDAGKIVRIKGSPVMGEAVCQQSWLDACNRGEPFFFQHSPPDSKITLNRADFVFVYRTIHKEKEENMDNIVDLVNCMQRKKEAQTDHWDWPQFIYTPTHATHFSSATGKFDWDWAKNHMCSCTSGPSVTQIFEMELARMEHILPVVGTKTFARELTLGLLHGTERRRGLFDCVHWMMPGIPDLFVKEMIEWILSELGSRAATVSET